MGENTNYMFIRKSYIDQVQVVPNQSALSDNATFYFFRLLYVGHVQSHQ